MKNAANRDRLFVLLVWKTLRGLITYSSLATVLLTTAISIGILLFAERIAERNNYSLGAQESKISSVGETGSPVKFWGLSKAAWLGVSGSIFASAVFWLVQGAMYLFNQAKQDTYEEVYRSLVEEAGMTAILTRKGGDEATAQYKKSINNARERIWAIGMSNKHFILQHLDSILDLAKRRRGLDVIVAFWSPDAYLQTRKVAINEGDGKHRRKSTTAQRPLSLNEGLPVFVVQAMLEGRDPATAEEIKKRQAFIIDRINRETWTSKYGSYDKG